MTEELKTMAPRKRPRRTRFGAALFILVGVAVGLAVGWWYLVWAEERDFQAALAETDRLDPGWRLEDIEAAREPVPDDRNAALVVGKVCNAVGPPWANVLNVLYSTVPNARLNTEQVATLRGYLEREARARAEAQPLRHLTTGRYPSIYDARSASVSQHALVPLLKVAQLLDVDATLAIHDGDSGLVADICQASINTARSTGDEPNIMGILVYVGGMETSLRILNRGWRRARRSRRT